MRALLLTLVVMVGAFLSGCGLVDTHKQRMDRYGAIVSYQSRMAVDDWDYLWLMERPTYLSYWYVRYAD